MTKNCRLYGAGHHTHRFQAQEAKKEVLVPVEVSAVTIDEVRVTFGGREFTFFQHNVLDLYGDSLGAAEGEVLLALHAEVLFLRKHEAGESRNRKIWRPWSLASGQLSECSDSHRGNGHFRARN